MQNSMNIHLSTSASDYSDAYCHVKRSKILSGVARVMPEILSPTQRRLEAVQDIIYFGSEEDPVSSKQAVGLTQGQATSGQLYSLGIHPLNEELSALAHQHESGILSAYIDDVKAHSAAELIAGIIAIQQDKGLDFGAKLNMNKYRILLESCQDDDRAVQRYFHDTFQIPLARNNIHPDNISDPSEKATLRRHHPWDPSVSVCGIHRCVRRKRCGGDLSGMASGLASAQGGTPSPMVPPEFTYLFRGIPPGFAQPLADCLTQLHRETCEILAQCKTVPDISFDLARIREVAGLG
jgi:hypothetical protein